jgi:subtilisin family serine protease
MNKLDPRLRRVLRTLPAETAGPAEPAATIVPELSERVGWEATSPEVLEVLIRAADDRVVDELRADGIEVQFPTRGATTVASVQVPLQVLETLQDNEAVERIEASRPMFTDLDISGADVRATGLHRPPLAVRGGGVIVGIVDGGIDYTHPSLRNADGSSRILFLWDQGAPPVPGGPVPLGREYTKADLDAALASPNPRQLVPHEDTVDGHGTHVAGIAAGNERTSGGRFTGIAPDADLIAVAYESEGGVTLGRSSRAYQALSYIVQRAQHRPVAINVSQGMNSGGHIGETVLETGLDNLVREPGVVVVKSAGNEQQWNTHAGGQLRQGETIALELVVRSSNRQDDVVELWYDGSDRIGVALQPPDGPPLPAVAPGQQRTFETPAGNLASIESDINANDTGDTAVTIILTRGDAGVIQPGTWRLHLRGDVIRAGRYDAWIERAQRDALNMGEQTRFSPASAESTRTITIPGTARRIITVGSYVTRSVGGFTSSPPRGQISSFSSRGPTRLGLLKPEVAAPGEEILSARSSNSTRLAQPDRFHTGMSGTSMAAPHVTGAAALVLSIRPNLTCEQVKQIIMRTARRDGFTSDAPDTTWGNGRLDVTAAVEQARTARFPRIEHARVDGTSLAWNTEPATSGGVRFHSSRSQLQLGKTLGSRTDPTLRNAHMVDLADLEFGTYFCEILVTSQDGWWTVDDNGGALHTITVSRDTADELEAAPAGMVVSSSPLATAEQATQPEPSTLPDTVPGQTTSVPEEPLLEIGNLVLNLSPGRGAANARQRTKPRARVSFRLSGAAVGTPALSKWPCFVQILAHEPTTGSTNFLGGRQQRLRANQRSYSATLTLDLPGPGRYQVFPVVLVSEASAVATSVGSTIEIEA